MIYYGLLAFFALEYIRPGSYLPALNALHLNTLVPALICAKTFLGEAPVTTQDALADKNTKRIGTLIALILLSVLTADVTEYAYNKFIAVIGYVLVFWVINKQIVDLRQLKGIFKALVLVHVVIGALTPEMFTSGQRTYIASGSFLGDGNDFALSVNIAVPMCLFLLTNETKMRQKLFWGAALLFLVFAIVATQSRGGTLALVAVGLYYWAKSNRKGITALMGLLAIAVVFALAPSGYFERMHNVANTEEGSAQGRIQAWSAGLRMAADHPLLGVGAGHFFMVYGSRYGKEGAPWQNAHSIYFQILAELGIPGILTLLWCIFGNLLENRKVLHEIRARDPDGSVLTAQLLASTSATMIAFAAGGAFLSAVYYPHIFMVAAVMTASRRIALRQAEHAAGATAPVPAASHITIHPALRRRPKLAMGETSENKTAGGRRPGGGALKPV